MIFWILYYRSHISPQTKFDSNVMKLEWAQNRDRLNFKSPENFCFWSNSQKKKFSELHFSWSLRKYKNLFHMIKISIYKKYYNPPLGRGGGCNILVDNQKCRSACIRHLNQKLWSKTRFPTKQRKIFIAWHFRWFSSFFNFCDIEKLSASQKNISNS